MIECISVSNDYDMADMKFIYHRGLPFSCDNCAIDEKESMSESDGRWLQWVASRWGLIVGL